MKNTQPTFFNQLFKPLMGNMFFFTLISVFWSGVTSFVYFLFFSHAIDDTQFGENVRDVLKWSGIFLVFYILVYRSAVSDYRTLSDFKESKRLEYISDTQRIRRMFNAHPNETKKILADVSSELIASQKTSVSVKEMLSAKIETIYSPELIRVDNASRLKIAENTLNELLKFDPLHIQKEYESFLRMLEESNSSSLHLSTIHIENSPLLRSLSQNGLTKEHLKLLKDEFFNYVKFYKDAEIYLKKEVAIIGSGVAGEIRTNEELEMYEGIWKNYSNVRFEVDGKSVESDNIIVSTKGIFTLEVKNYSPKGNYSIHVKKDGQWLKLYSNGDTEPMTDVTTQMNRHIAIKHKKIREDFMRKHNHPISFSLLPIFVIANDNVQITNDTELPIMRVSQIYHHIINKPDVLTPEEVEKISAIIEENMLPPKTYEMENYLPVLKESFERLSEREKHFKAIIELGYMYQKHVKEALIEKEKTFKQKYQ